MAGPPGAPGGSGAPTAGSSETLEVLLPPHLDTAYRIAYRLSGNQADAEDLVQEAAFLAAKGFRTFRPGTNFKAWFFRILTNAFYSKYRKQRREGDQVDIDDASDAYLYHRAREVGLQQREPDPVSRLMTTITTEQIGAALEALPEEYRTVATLYFEEDFSYQEIARVLDVPVGTVRSRLHRGRKLLQRKLWDVAVEAGIVTDAGAE